MTERIVFVDLDGVIWPIGSMHDVDVPEVVRRPFEHLDLVVERASVAAVRRLRTLATEAPAQFVLISTWRKVFPPEFIKETLCSLGLFEHFHEDWEAGFRFSSAKGDDIADWLGDHRSLRTQDVLVIDDEPQSLRGIRQVLPVANVGFSDSDLTEAMEHFRRAAFHRAATEALRKSVQIVAKGKPVEDRSG